MSYHLQPLEIQAITNLVSRWEGKITWDLVTEKCRTQFGIKISRQALSSHESIHRAFSDYKKAGGGKSTGKVVKQNSRPQSLKAASDRIDRLEKEIERLERENRLYKEMFIIWQKNARNRNISIEELSRPLVAVDKDRTD